MPQLIEKIVSQEMQKNIRDYSLDTNEQNLPPEKLKQRWENRATIYEANVTTIGAFRDVMQLALIVSGRNEDAAKVHAMFSTMMNLMSSYQHSAALMGKAAMETGAAQEALQQAAAGALVSGWVGVAIVVAGLLMSPKNDGDQQAKYLARQFEELHKSIGQLHTSMLKQFSQLHYRLDQFEGNVYQSLNQINEFIQSLGQVAIQTSQKIDYANEVLAQIHRDTEEVRWDLVEGLITNQKKTLSDIAREIGGRGDLNGTLKQILSRLEISANLMSQFNGNSISGGKALNGGRALRLLGTPEYSPANLLAPLSAQVLRDPSMNARRMVHLKEWSDLVALSSKLLVKQKNIEPELLTELSQTLTAQAQDLNELRAGLHARRFDILNGILNQIDFNHANLKIYIQSLWEKAVLETAEELKMKGSYDRPQVVMDMRLCDLQDDMAPRQNSEQLKKFIVDGLTQNDRARIFFTPRSKILGPRKFDPGIPDTESGTVRACLRAGTSNAQVLAGGYFWSGFEAIGLVANRYFGIRGGSCSVVYPVNMKVQLAHTNALSVKDLQISSQYFYNYIKDTVPVEAQSLPYAQKFADLEFKVEDPKIAIQIAEFGQNNWERWGNRRVRAHQQGLSEIACRSKWVAAPRDISREQAFIAAILAPPTDYHSGDNNPLLIHALLDKNMQASLSGGFGTLMETIQINPANVPWAGMKTEPSAMQVSEYKISDQPKNQPKTGAPSPEPSLQRKENVITFFKDFIPMPKDEAIVKNNPFHSEYSNYLLNKDLSSIGASQMSADLNTPDPHIVQAFYAKATNRFLRNLIRLTQEEDDPTDENRRIPVSVRYLLVQNELLAKMVPVFMNFVYGNDPRVFEKLSNMTREKIATTDSLLFLAYSVLHKGIWKVDLKKVNLLKPVDLAQKLTYETYLAREFMNDTTSAPLLIDLATSEGLNRLRAESVEILSIVGEKLPAASFQNQLDQTLNLIKKKVEYNIKE
jgi:DNA-binding ferritin-like protein